MTTIATANASANTPCTGMVPGMTQMDMTSKSNPCMPKAPDCVDMSGCILAAAKLAEPLDLKHPVVWSTSVYSLISADIPSSMDIRPDHSPPRFIA